LWLGVYGALLFMTTACAQSVRRPDYDEWHQSVSALSLGPDGWIQSLSFLLFGLIVLSTAPAWRRVLQDDVGGTAVPALTVITGASIIATGLLPQDPAPGYDPMQLALTEPTVRGLLHLLFAAIGAGSTVACLVVMARRFAHDPLWRGWTGYTLLMAAVMTISIAIYAVWSTASTGYAGTFERIGLLVFPLWGASFLGRLANGTPFQHQDAPAAAPAMESS
jgi:hypothetical protein